MAEIDNTEIEDTEIDEEPSEYDKYKQKVVDSAKVRLTYLSNISISNSAFSAVLNEHFDDGVNIITDWRKLKDNSEIVSGKWTTQLTNYIVNAYASMNEDNLKSSSSNGVSRTYRMSAEAILKSKVPQRMF